MSEQEQKVGTAPNYAKIYLIKCQNLERTIMAIYANPNYEYDFIELARLFQNFCYELNPDWNTLVFTLDNNEKN